MKIMLRYTMLLVILWLPIIAVANDCVNSLYCAVLGNEDASMKYQEIIREALQDFGVVEFNTVAVKKMSSLPKRLLGNSLISFTMQGIWIDEELLLECPEEEVVFTLYHEAAHYVKRHHAKLLLMVVPASVIFYGITHWPASLLERKLKYKLLKVGLIGLLSGGALMALDRFLMRPLVREFEKDAELEAARLLCRLHKQKIVSAHIDFLKSSLLDKSDNNTESWWYSLADRIKFVSACLQECVSQ